MALKMQEEAHLHRATRLSGRVALLEALGVDGVLTVGQAAAVSGIPRDAVGSVLGKLGMTRVRPVRATAGSALAPVPLVVLTHAGVSVAEDRLGRRVRLAGAALDHEVEHALGVAQLRHRLGVAPQQWTTAAELLARAHAGRHRGRGLPDGIAEMAGMRVAAEYDFGNYAPRQIALKQRTAQTFGDRIIWAAPTARRAEWLRARGCADVIIVHIPH